MPSAISDETIAALWDEGLSSPEIAERVGLTRSAIDWRLKRLYGPTRSERDWTSEEDALLGTAIDREVAVALGRSLEQVEARRRRLGIHGHAGRARPWTPAEEELLRSDRSAVEIAALIRRTPAAVARMRHRLGIKRNS